MAWRTKLKKDRICIPNYELILKFYKENKNMSNIPKKKCKISNKASKYFFNFITNTNASVLIKNYDDKNKSP